MTEIERNAIFVVGHRNWGKSQTLLALTDGVRVHHWEYDGFNLYVKRMSNDDKPTGLLDFSRTLRPATNPNVVMALCPNFHDAEAKTETILHAIRHHRYRMWFWVIANAYQGDRRVSDGEIARLSEYGTAEVVQERWEAAQRGRALATYISRVLRNDFGAGS